MQGSLESLEGDYKQPRHISAHLQQLLAKIQRRAMQKLPQLSMLFLVVLWYQ
ncbi:MAG: hypothetical protein HRU20_30120 [Pseudomonadales bacterium]|nr:hypothetical protein [Pseudomonadales bacterium]